MTTNIPLHTKHERDRNSPAKSLEPQHILLFLEISSGSRTIQQNKNWGDEIVHEHLDKVLTIEELAAYLKISKSSLYKLAQKGEIPGQKVGKHWRFRRDITDQLLAESTPAVKRKDKG